jgi:hypothetical protein
MGALTQTQVNAIQATGTSQSVTHNVSEMTWPVDPNNNHESLVKWPLNLGTPSMWAYQDMGPPTYQFVIGVPFHVVPTGQTAPLSVVGVLVPSYSLAFVPGVGGQDWLSKMQYSLFSPTSALAWWSWTISLIA